MNKPKKPPNPHLMIARLIYFCFEFLQCPITLKVSAFSDNPRSDHPRTKHLVSLCALLIATGIVLFVTQTTILQDDAHAATDIWFDNAADFMSESQLFEWIIRNGWFPVESGNVLIVPMSLFLIAVTRSVLRCSQVSRTLKSYSEQMDKFIQTIRRKGARTTRSERFHLFLPNP